MPINAKSTDCSWALFGARIPDVAVKVRQPASFNTSRVRTMLAWSPSATGTARCRRAMCASTANASRVNRAFFPTATVRRPVPAIALGPAVPTGNTLSEPGMPCVDACKAAALPPLQTAISMVSLRSELLPLPQPNPLKPPSIR